MQARKFKFLFLSAGFVLALTFIWRMGETQYVSPKDPGFTSNRNGTVPEELVVIEGAKAIGNDACYNCHPQTTPTAFKPEGESRQVAKREWDLGVHEKVQGVTKCESCHGPGSKHGEVNNKEFIVNPGRFARPEQNELCQSCHQLGTVSIHSGADVSCLDCHQFHSLKNPKLLKKLPEKETCYSCHSQQRLEFNMFTHHPVNEGILSCTDCHAAHFSIREESLKRSPTIMGPRASTGSCGSCHPQEAGPFVTGNANLTGCIECHSPHGSPMEKLERQPQPALCMKCHQPTTCQFFHASATTLCTQCHVLIHGTNHNRMFYY